MEAPEHDGLNNLGAIVSRNAARAPDRIAILDGSGSLTWSDVEDRTNRLANGLAARGVKEGDRVAFLLPNSRHWVEATFATLKLGAVWVALNYRLSRKELEVVLEDCRPSALIVADRFAELGLPSMCGPGGTVPVIRVGSPGEGQAGYEDFLADSDDSRPEVEVSREALASISFTSGTTGTPKGVMWSHGTLLATIPDNPFPGEICREARQMVLAPSFVAGAQIQILNAAYHGAALILQDFHPPEVMRRIERDRPTLLASAAVMLRLLATLPDADRWDTSSLKRIYYGGAPIGTPEDFEAIRRVFDCEYQQGYGSAETSILIARLEPEDHERLDDPVRARRLRSAGRVAAGAQVKLVGPGGEQVPPGAGTGEIAVKAPWVMKGYWQRPRETAEVFDRDGYYHTRDMGFFDKDGYLFLVDRKDDMIKSGGLNVYPSEVERVLATHPAVEEVAVIGVPHPRWETAVAAVIRPVPGRQVTQEELRSFCKERIGSYKVPKMFFFRPDPLPRTPLGKVQRRLVRESVRHEAAELLTAARTEQGRKESLPQGRKDPLRHCRRCEFQDVCQKFCDKYFR